MVAGLTLAAAVALALLLVTGPSPAAPYPGAARHTARAAARSTVARSTAARTATPSPGSLPRTHAYPSGTSVQFKTLMAALGAAWRGIR